PCGELCASRSPGAPRRAHRAPRDDREGHVANMRPGATAGVCEDDDELRGVLRGALQREGLTVRATSSGSEAVRIFAAAPPDVVVLDIRPPDADARAGRPA